MSTNLRLSEQAAAALRAEAHRTGRSQQDLLREAVDQYLGLRSGTTALDQAVAAGIVRAPSAFRDVEPLVRLGSGMTSASLLDRDGDR